MNVGLLDYINQNWGGVVAIAILLVAIVVSIKIAVSFDVNKFIDQRKRSHLNKAQSACPHVYFEIQSLPDGKSGTVTTYSYLETTFGTTKWRCTKCGCVFLNSNEEDVERLGKYYIEHPHEYAKVMKKVNKHIRKSL